MSQIDRAREMLPVTRRFAYLNTASMGPVTTVFAEALAECTEEDVRGGRAIPRRYELLEEARERLRKELALLLRCPPERLCLTQSTSAGLEQVISSFCWAPGDEVITTDVEHEACALPLRREAERSGLTLRVAQVPPELTGDPRWIEELITPRTKLIVFSAVAFETGAQLPVADIAAVARRHEVFTLVDGAQCAGARDFAPGELGVDFCAMPLQKWLCGPEGLGVLYVREPSMVAPGVALSGRVIQGRPMLEAAATQLEWMRKELGWDWIFERTQALAAYARDLSLALGNGFPLTPNRFAGITTIRSDLVRLPEAAAGLGRRGFIVRCFPEMSALRISTAYFNTEEELDELFSAIDNVMRSVHPE